MNREVENIPNRFQINLPKQIKMLKRFVWMRNKKLQIKEKADKEESWWDFAKKAVDLVKEAVSKIMNFLKELYNTARKAINTIIQTARCCCCSY